MLVSVVRIIILQLDLTARINSPCMYHIVYPFRDVKAMVAERTGSVNLSRKWFYQQLKGRTGKNVGAMLAIALCPHPRQDIHSHGGRDISPRCLPSPCALILAQTPTIIN